MEAVMNEEDIRKILKPAFEETRDANMPDFDAAWARAQSAHGNLRRRSRMLRGIAAMLVLAVSGSLFWLSQQAEVSDDFLIADALMNSTLWSAPSDSLMPEHQFDIYQEIPFLIESTDSLEGTLL